LQLEEICSLIYGCFQIPKAKRIRFCGLMKVITHGLAKPSNSLRDKQLRGVLLNHNKKQNESNYETYHPAEIAPQ
jgi:hypothetical protein